MATNNRFITSYNGLTELYPSSTGIVDPRTGVPYVGGGLYLGATSELTESEALSLTPSGSPLVYAGRYRFVAIDPAATAANLTFGKAVGWKPGGSVQNVSILTAGSGQTPGYYTAAGSSGIAIIGYVINGSGTLASAWVIQGGSYADGTIPTFTIDAGGTPGTVVAQMNIQPNYITSMDQAFATTVPRGIYLGPEPAASDLANPAYAWIVEAGKAPVIGNASGSQGAAGAIVNATNNGTVNSYEQTWSASTIGYALDTPEESALYRVQLTLPNFGG
jgi:hypothetical protein